MDKNQIKKIGFVSCRKLGSYLWFYLNIKPFKIYIKNPPLDQFDIWKDLSYLEESKIAVLIDNNNFKQVNINNFKISKTIKLDKKFNYYLLILNK